MKMIEEGKPAPDFTLVSDSGESVWLSQLRGSAVVLFFYPKDDTPGCTAQACGIRDAWGEFERSGAVVLGVSPDSPTISPQGTRSHLPTMRCQPVPRCQRRLTNWNAPRRAYTPAPTMCSTTGRGEAKKRALSGVITAPLAS